MLWITPRALKVMKRTQAISYTCTFCMFGLPWRKATNFVSVHLGLAWMDNFRCNGPNGVCQRTGLKHTILQGKDLDKPNQFLALSAQPYPRMLCTQLAKSFVHASTIQLSKNSIKSSNHLRFGQTAQGLGRADLFQVWPDCPGPRSRRPCFGWKVVSFAACFLGINCGLSARSVHIWGHKFGGFFK